MNQILSFLTVVALTILICFLLVHYLSPNLKSVLADLCATEERAKFWMVFATILLMGLPVIISLGFCPEGGTLDECVFEVIGRLSWVLAGFIFAHILVGIGGGFFVLVTPRQTKRGVK